MYFFVTGLTKPGDVWQCITAAFGTRDDVMEMFDPMLFAAQTKTILLGLYGFPDT